MNQIGSTDMTPMGYLKVFFRRKEYLLIPILIGLTLGICLSIILPKRYISSAVILVEESKSDNPLFDRLAVSTSVKQRMTAIRESMLGWNSLVTLVKRLKMDKTVRSPRELEKLILDIRKDISIRLRGHNIINLSYEGKEPEQTKAVVQNVVDIFIERNVQIQNQETADAILFIEQQLKVYRGKIKSAEIAQMKDNLKALLVDSTEAHPRVKELREQISVKQKELEEENLIYSENVLLDTNSTSPIVEEIKRALDNLEGGREAIPAGVSEKDSKDDFYKVMLIEKLDNVMARDVDVNNMIYNMLLQRLETAKITQRLQSSKEGTKYTILDPPRIPLDPVKPNKMLISMGGLIFGAIIGFGLVIGFEFLDKSFIDVEEAKKFLGVPLLGAISKINTEASIRRQREKLGWIYSLTIIGGVIAVILTTAIANFIQ